MMPSISHILQSSDFLNLHLIRKQEKLKIHPLNFGTFKCIEIQPKSIADILTNADGEDNFRLLSVAEVSLKTFFSC